VVVDDGRRFVDRTPPGHFDLIVLDVPAPYHVRTALLHTPSFYREVARRLAPGGVAAISLCDELEGPVGRAIAASAARAFGEIAVVESDAVGMGILYASPAELPFSVERVRAELAARDPEGGRVFDDAQARGAIAGAAPIDEGRLATVLVMARGALP
jgi:spermidine synthase